MSTKMDPCDADRRSLLNRWHQGHGAAFTECNGAMFVADYGNVDSETSVAGRLGLCDLSTLNRGGICGPGAVGCLERAGQNMPGAPNQALRLSSGDLLARLSQDEFLHIGLSQLNSKSNYQTQVVLSPDASKQCYPVPRGDSHCLFSLSGHAAATAMSTLCGVDLREKRFANGQVAQTSLARISGIVIRSDLGSTLNYLLLVATPAAEYFWECLIDATQELGGAVVGINSIMIVASGRRS